MENLVSTGWLEGSYKGLSDEIVNRLNQLKSEGYELIIKPHVSIGGRNPVPDFLFVKKVGAKYNLNECIYIDKKYFHDVGFTKAQKEIEKPFKNGATEAIIIASDDIRVLSDNSVITAGSTMKVKKIEIFTIKDDLSLGKIDKP